VPASAVTEVLVKAIALALGFVLTLALVLVLVRGVRRMTAPRKPLSWKRILLPPPIMMKGIFSFFRAERIGLGSAVSIYASAGPPMRNVQCAASGSLKRMEGKREVSFFLVCKFISPGSLLKKFKN